MMTYETRTKAAHALRTTTARQISGYLSDREGGRCGNGVICEAFGIPLAPRTDLEAGAFDALGDLGIDYWGVVQRNDGICYKQHTFAEIADWLEQEPVCDPPQIPDFAPGEIEVAA